MEPFAFIVCAGLCKIVPPLDGQSRESCLYRMSMSLAADPKTRVACESLDWPYGEVIDSWGIWKPKIPPWLRTQASEAK